MINRTAQNHGSKNLASHRSSGQLGPSFRLTGPLIAIAVLCSCSDASSSGGGGNPESDTAIGLGTAPISLSSALAASSAAPQQAADSCPFLSDATAISTVKNADDFVLRTASNEKCVWNRNIGFEIAVTVEPASSATPIAKRLYNLDNPPVIEPQSGPGRSAAAALDPTWKERDPRPYAFGFNLDDHYVFIRTTGVYTSIGQLRTAANEIAAKLPNAPAVTAAAATPAAPAFDVCGIWTKAALRDLFGVVEGGRVSSHASNAKTCIASIFPSSSSTGNKISLDFIFSAATPGEYEFRKSNGWTAVELAGKPALFKQSNDQFGEANQFMAMTDEGNFALTILTNSGDMKGKAEKLFENALSRLEE